MWLTYDHKIIRHIDRVCVLCGEKFIGCAVRKCDNSCKALTITAVRNKETIRREFYYICG